VTFVGLHSIDVLAIDPAVCGDILTEIGARHRLTYLALDQSLIGFANNAIGVCVTDKETKLDVAVRLAVAVDVLRAES
jgi:hypothetical protein